ncbi:MAG: putative solute-binding protein [Pseudomonadota bacterium]
MSSIIRCIRPALFSLAALLAPAAASALTPVTVCVYDPLGTHGEAFGMARDQALVARQWGVDMTLRAYTNEGIAAEDFKAGQCDGAALTTIRARQFSAFAGSIDSVGALPTQRHMRLLLAALANPKLAPRMVSDNYEVAGVIPMGPAYVMVIDRRIDSVEKAAGKKVAVLDIDRAQAKIVQRLGAQPVASDLSNFAGKFNNHQVDVLVAPVLLYKPLELHKGIGTKGAIYRFPLGQISATLLIRRDRFPAGYGQQSRAYVLTQADKAFAIANRAEREIPAAHWLSLSAPDEARYVVMMAEARQQLTAEGIYDADMMRLAQNIRCKLEPARGECAGARR